MLIDPNGASIAVGPVVFVAEVQDDSSGSNGM